MFHTQFLLLNSYYYTNTTTTHNLTDIWKRNINELTRYNEANPGNKCNSNIDKNECIHDNDRCEYIIKGLANDKKIERQQILAGSLLSQESVIYNGKCRELILPLIEDINLDDLNIDDDDYYTINNEDIKFNKDYQPLFTRRNKKEIIDNYDDDDKKKKKKNTGKNDTDNDQTGIRNQLVNPNFLKLYAIENSAIKKQILPEIIVDLELLQLLDSARINQLDFDSNIRLAILTKKKIWIDMLNNYNSNKRTITDDKHFPWNLEFVPINQGCNDKNYDHIMQQLHSSVMNYKPCGKISRGSKHSHIQYVVKGWYDSRFQQ